MGDFEGNQTSSTDLINSGCAGVEYMGPIL